MLLATNLKAMSNIIKETHDVDVWRNSSCPVVEVDIHVGDGDVSVEYYKLRDRSFEV